MKQQRRRWDQAVQYMRRMPMVLIPIPPRSERNAPVLATVGRYMGTVPVLSKTRPPAIRFMESSRALDPRPDPVPSAPILLVFHVEECRQPPHPPRPRRLRRVARSISPGDGAQGPGERTHPFVSYDRISQTLWVSGGHGLEPTTEIVYWALVQGEWYRKETLKAPE